MGGLVGGFTGGRVGGLTGRGVRDARIGFAVGFLTVFGGAVFGGLLWPGSGRGIGAGPPPFFPCGFLVGFGTACLPPLAVGFGLALVAVVSWRRTVLSRVELTSCA